MTTRADLLDAWRRFDKEAETFSDRRGYGATSETLKHNAEQLERTNRVYAAEIGLGAVALRALCQAWRRAGRDHDRALAAVEAGARQ